MADYYASQQVGVADGTNPPGRADGRQVGAKKRTILASKVAGQAWAAADRVFLGFLEANEKITRISLTTDTSFATATISIGNGTTANLWADVKTVTVTDVPTAIGPKASTLIASFPTARQAIWATIGTAGVAGAVIANFEIEVCGIG